MAAVKFSGGHSHGVLCVDTKSDGTLIASGAEEGELCIWRRDGSLVHKMSQQASDCTSVVFSKVKDNILYTSFGDTVFVFQIPNFHTPVETFKFNEEEINQIVLDEKEAFLAACDDSGEIKIISLQERRLFKTLRRKHTNICATVCFRPRRQWDIFSGGMDCNLIHWDFSRLKCVNQFNMQELQDTPSDVGAYMVNPPFVHHLATSPDGKYLACALENGLISVFDCSRKNMFEKFSLQAHSQGVSQVAFLTDSVLLSGGNDSHIMVWDLNKPSEHPADGTETLPTNGHTSPIHDRNANVTELCKVEEIQHDSKINWLAPFRNGTQYFVVIADQTANLTVFPVPLNSN